MKRRDSADNVFLPVDCWEQILSRFVVLTDEKALEPISLVCKDFLSISNSLRRKFSLYVTDHDDNSIAQLIDKRFPYLEDVHLIIGPNIDSANFEVTCCTSNLKKLKKLRVFFRPCVPDNTNIFGNLSRLSGSLSSLKTLEFSGCGIQDKHLKQIGDCLSLLEELCILDPCRSFYIPHFQITDVGVQFLSLKLKYLKKIKLFGYLSDVSLIALASNCVFLRELALKGFPKVTMSGIGYFICHCPNLVSFSVPRIFSATPYIPYGEPHNRNKPEISSIEDSIACAKDLHSLALPRLQNGDITLQSIVSAKLPLKSLSFGSSYCTLSGLRRLLQAYPSLLSLRIWDDNSLSNESIGYLSKWFQSLTSITLSGLDLSNQSFFILVRNCPSLETIKMEHTSLGRGDIETSIGKNVKIRYLKFSCNTFLDDLTLEIIGQACPNLQCLTVKLCRRVTSKGITEILKTCKKMRVLWLFHFHYREILDLEAEALELNLEELSVYESFNLDHSVANIGRLCPRLQKISLMNCHKFSQAGILDLVAGCKMLKEINLKSSEFEDTDITSKIYGLRPLMRVFCSL